MQVQKPVQLLSVRVIALAFALLVALLLASAAGYIIRGNAPNVVATQPVAHEQPPDARERNLALQKAAGFKGPDALERDQRLRNGG